MRTEWDPRIQNDIKRAITDALTGVSFPSWLEVLYIEFNPKNNTSEAEIGVELRYRRAILTVAPALLEDSPDERADTIRHEVAHIFLAPLDTAWDVMRKALDKDARAMMDEMYQEATEAVATDLCYRWRT